MPNGLYTDSGQTFSQNVFSGIYVPACMVDTTDWARPFAVFQSEFVLSLQDMTASGTSLRGVSRIYGFERLPV